MALPKVAALIAERLNSIGIKWMATGSIASMSYGEYRVTNDVDIVLVLAESDIKRLIAAFPLDEFYCPPSDVIAVEAARQKHGHFNLIHHATGFKADLYIAGKDRLSAWALQHRQPVVVEDSTIWLAPPEYVIIGKLEFFQEGGSEKHLRDIRGMLAVTDVDRSLLENEVAQRGLTDVWSQCI